MSRAMQFDIVANDKATPNMAKVEKSMASFGQKVGAGMTMAAAKAMAAWAAVTKVMDVIGELGDVADQAARVGVSVETYQRLKFAAEDYGSSVEEIAKAMKDVNKLLDQAATKGGPDLQVLQALGFSMEEIASRAIRTEEVFRRVGDAIKEAATEEEKFALASRVFGDRIAQSMIPVLENFKDFEKTGESVGVMSQRTAEILDASSTRFNKRMTGIKAAFGDMLADLLLATGVEKEPQGKVDSRTEAQRESARKARDELLKAQPTKGAAGEGANMAVTTLQQIGGGLAKAISPAEVFAERTAVATETIAAVATSAAPAPTGGTDITKESDRPFLSPAKTTTTTTKHKFLGVTLSMTKKNG